MSIINDLDDILTAPTAPTAPTPSTTLAEPTTILKRPIPSYCAHSALFSECLAPPLKRPCMQAASTSAPSKALWDIFVQGKEERRLLKGLKGATYDVKMQ